MATHWSSKLYASFLQHCNERCAGAWNTSAWWIPMAQAFTIQTTIHFACFVAYLLHANRVLPFTDPSLGDPYSVFSPNASLLVPVLSLLYRLLIRAPLVEEIRYRGTVWLGLLVFRQRWVHWLLVACASVLWAFIHERALLGTVEIITAGFFTGWLVLKTKNIVPAMLFHSAWNAAVLLTAYAGLK